MLRSFGWMVLTACCLGTMAVGGSPVWAGGDESHPPNAALRWEADVDAMEAADRKDPPAKRATLFVGSSSIRLWDLKRSFPGRAVVNRGFGGSHLSDVAYFADRIVVPHRPKEVVIYAGDNDIAANKSTDRVMADLESLVMHLHQALPDARIYFISIKPSLARWEYIDRIRLVNDRALQMSENLEWLTYVDIFGPMLTSAGKPRSELLQEDGLHLTAQGYELWSEILQRHLQSSRTDPENGTTDPE